MINSVFKCAILLINDMKEKSNTTNKDAPTKSKDVFWCILSLGIDDAKSNTKIRTRKWKVKAFALYPYSFTLYYVFYGDKNK